MPAPKKVDYDAIEPDWRAGIKTPTQMAYEYTQATGINVSRAAIIKHFKARNVPRDLTAKVQSKARAMVAEAMVTGKVSAKSKVAEEEIVDKAASDVATILISHRKDINRSRTIAEKLEAQLEHQIDSPEVYERLAELVIDEAGDPMAADKLRHAFNKAMGLSGHVKTFKELVEARRILIGLEREAFGIGASTGSDGGFEEFLQSLKK